MVGKHALVFILAFCAVQGYSPVSISESRGPISNILEQIKILIAAINKLILDLPKFINNFITDLRNKIREAIGSINIAGIISAIEDSIEKILNSVGIEVSVASHCIDAQKVSVNNLIENALQEIDDCRVSAEEGANELEAQLRSLLPKALSLLKEIMGEIPRCFLNHPLNPIKQAKCLTALLSDINNKAYALSLQVVITTVTATTKALVISSTVVECTARINSDIDNGQLQIIGNFQTCVDNIVNQ